MGLATYGVYTMGGKLLEYRIEPNEAIFFAARLADAFNQTLVVKGFGVYYTVDPKGQRGPVPDDWKPVPNDREPAE
jgi:hypothetical protein